MARDEHKWTSRKWIEEKRWENFLRKKKCKNKNKKSESEKEKQTKF